MQFDTYIQIAGKLLYRNMDHQCEFYALCIIVLL